MSRSLIASKLDQAQGLVKQSGSHVWLTFVRETAESGDPILPFLIEGGLTWQSALLVGADGRRIAVVGKYDDDSLVSSGNWTRVETYVQSIREPLLSALDELVPAGVVPRIAINTSINDEKADGLTHGMWLLLNEYFDGTRYAGCMESAEGILTSLRSQKSDEELRRIRLAIGATEIMFETIEQSLRLGMSELDLYHVVHQKAKQRDQGFSWDPAGDPIVNFGPNSAIGHALPSPLIKLEPGHLVHVDLGLLVEGYASDLQRCWYVTSEEAPIPTAIEDAADTVIAAIKSAFLMLRPGVAGWEVDKVARDTITATGRPEYMHATGHQVGRTAHDGGGILGPRWTRYGNRPHQIVQPGEVYTLELGVDAEGYGSVSLEEMALVTDTGAEWLSQAPAKPRVVVVT